MFENKKKLAQFFTILIMSIILISTLPNAAHAIGGISLYTPFPGLKMKSGQTVDFSVQIINTTGIDKQVQLRLAEVPEGWNESPHPKNMLSPIICSSDEK